jgi:hypothetical protein
MFQIFAAISCDYFWFIRNKAHHDGFILNALIISSTLNKTVLKHHSAWTTKLVTTPEVWKRYSPPFFNIKYDTAIRDSFSAQDAICRDSTGSIIQCISLISSPYSAIYCEAIAARLAISLDLFFFIL